MRGVIAWGVYLPHGRLDCASISPVAGIGGGVGTRTVASYDEDATTMAVEAGRIAMRTVEVTPTSLWFVTTAPPYLDKTNAAAVHAALRLARSIPAYDAVGAVRSALGALRAGLLGPGTSLVAAADIRTGLPGSADEATGGDAGGALLVGEGEDASIAAELLAWGASTEEFLDRWRTPGAPASKTWEERSTVSRYVDLGLDAWHAAAHEAGVGIADIDHVVVGGTHARARMALLTRLGVPRGRLVDDLSGSVGNVGAAGPALLLAMALERAKPGERIAIIALADGADALVFRATEVVSARAPVRSVAAQIADGSSVAYGTFLSWRGHLALEPPRRPEPQRPSSTAAARNSEWKFGFVGSERDGLVELPPSPLGGSPRPMSEAVGTIATFTVDRLAYSPSPPIVFAIVDFDGGGRVPIELTDVRPDDVSVGTRVEMTFRKIFTADGIHNYFWKARPVRGRAS